MTDGRPAKRSLSDRLAGMSFMKRREERDKRETYAKRQKRREDDAHWTAPTAPSSSGSDAQEAPIVIVENGYGVEEPMLTFGRQSFGKFNASLEKRNEARAAGVSNVCVPKKPMMEQMALNNFREMREQQQSGVLHQNAPELMTPLINAAPVNDAPPPRVPVKADKGTGKGMNLGVKHVIAKVRQGVNTVTGQASGKESSRRKRKHKKR